MTKRKADTMDFEAGSDEPYYFTVADQCSNAVKLLNGRKKYTQQQVADKAGISRQTLQRFLENKDVGIKGRTPKLNAADLQEILNDVTKASLNLDTMDDNDLKLRMQHQMLKNQGFNTNASLSLVSISDTTFRNYKELMEVTSRRGKIKPESRNETYLNIRNAISKASGLTALARVCPLENMHSTDEVGIFLFGWHTSSKKPKLVSSREADEFLRKNNISLSSTEHADQQRVAHIGATLQAHTGSLTCYYIRITDSNFPIIYQADGTTPKPKVFLLDKETNFYAIFCNPAVTSTIAEDYIGRLIVLPAIVKAQETTIQREINGEGVCSQYGSQSQPDASSQPASQPKPEAEVREKYKHAVHMRDGAFGQINAGSALHEWCVRHAYFIFMVKTSAGQSMSESTNDLGYMHSILHRLFGSKDFKCKQMDDPPGPLYSHVKDYLQKYVTPTSFNTFWKCIVAMKPFMLKAFTPSNVLGALSVGGFEGPNININTMMGHNVEFSNLPQSQSDKVLGLIESVFSHYWYGHALIHEKVFNDVFEGEEDIDTLSSNYGKDLNLMATNRQRFMMDNHEAWLAEMSRRKEEANMISDEKERKRLEKEIKDANRPQKIRDCSDPSCPNQIDISNKKLKKDNEQLWSHCTGTRCNVWGCLEHKEMVKSHMAICNKINASK
mmetsp:Transcript_16093/g.15450  ORF Transcript_16093/g.15450 Transcript_16093/m.15450 type:complete len:669 (+) Transcript_16093:53-2059(+)|eukprot:CAMPEP_0119051018 /NCGR_PEP_ID=MMETSP1177-20130426/72768_1 /TAXON_ID=2985 /ORGANISM="Ochromonas sp, Strain CCMP1899" /LENGTH=668 /DNA_ID=CAMNT_0007030071 /DNA_START=2869 /DNA_END=4875 /DNA_ORIENTATION=+